MATAAAYDGWDDAGMVFSTDELEEYDPRAWASERVARLCAMRQVVQRYVELPDIPKPMWWKEVSKGMRQKITWYVTALLLVPPTEEEIGDVLPGRTSAAGKKLSLAAVGLEPCDWLGAWENDASASKRYVVTIGRRAGASCKWDKQTKKQSNVLANCVSQELHLLQKLDEVLTSRTVVG